MNAVTRIFFLSPANCAGKRAGILMRPQARFDLALRLRAGEATIGECYAFMSGLYFRGKLAYARAFARAPEGMCGIHVIVPGMGLVSPDYEVDLEVLRAIAKIPVDPEDARYAAPLHAHASRLNEQLDRDAVVVLLGSLATPKYLQPLNATVGARLRFPHEFIGLGDMSRGSMMLKAATAGRELTYIGLDANRKKGAA